MRKVKRSRKIHITYFGNHFKTASPLTPYFSPLTKIMAMRGRAMMAIVALMGR